MQVQIIHPWSLTKRVIPWAVMDAEQDQQKKIPDLKKFGIKKIERLKKDWISRKDLPPVLYL